MLVLVWVGCVIISSLINITNGCHITSRIEAEKKARHLILDPLVTSPSIHLFPCSFPSPTPTHLCSTSILTIAFLPYSLVSFPPHTLILSSLNPPRASYAFPTQVSSPPISPLHPHPKAQWLCLVSARRQFTHALAIPSLPVR